MKKSNIVFKIIYFILGILFSLNALSLVDRDILSRFHLDAETVLFGLTSQLTYLQYFVVIIGIPFMVGMIIVVILNFIASKRKSSFWRRSAQNFSDIVNDFMFHTLGIATGRMKALISMFGAVMIVIVIVVVFLFLTYISGTYADCSATASLRYNAFLCSIDITSVLLSLFFFVNAFLPEKFLFALGDIFIRIDKKK